MLSVLLAHNYYKGANPSGENVVFEAEAELLVAHGHTVHTYCRHSDEIYKWSARERLTLPKHLVWSKRSYVEMKGLISKTRPDVAHFHNTFPLISPSALRACHDMSVPVVQTLHNYRRLCINGGFFRNGVECQQCLGRKIPWRGVVHRCYGGSLSQSLAVAALQSAERGSSSYLKDVDLYIAPSEFVRRIYVAAGYPEQRIRVKPHFLNSAVEEFRERRNGAVFVGRLCVEKGVDILLSAWQELPEIPLLVIGDGPYATKMRAATASVRNVSWLGSVTPAEVLDHVRRAQCLVLPSRVPESFGLVAMEALASGTPVIASNVGALPELVRDGYSGVLTAPGDSEDLVEKVRYLNRHPGLAAELGANGQRDYQRRFTRKMGYEALIDAYRIATGLEHEENEALIHY